MARGVDALGAFQRWCWPPVVSLAARVVCHHRHRFLCGPILIGVHHEGHNRREGGSRPLTAPVGAVAGGVLMVAVWPPLPPPGHCGKRGLSSGGAGVFFGGVFPPPPVLFPP